MQKWRYLTCVIDDTGHCLISEGSPDAPPKWVYLDSLGTDGWELVTVGWAQEAGAEGVAIFKRSLDLK